MSIGELYLKTQMEMEAKYGRVIVMMEIGKFYEIYGFEVDGREVGAAREMSRLCNIILTRKNKSLAISMTNPHMCGFPNYNLNKYVALMVNHGYAVVVYDQDEKQSSIRRLRGVYSPSVMIGMDEDEEDRGIMAISVRKECVIMVYVNLSNGRVIIEDDGPQEDTHVFRLLDVFQPQEVIWNRPDEIDGVIVHPLPDMTGDERRFKETAFQEIFLSGIYTDRPENCAMMSTIEWLGLERNPDAVVLLCYLLSFLKEHHPLAVYRLQAPSFDGRTDKTFYNLHTLHDLNIISATDRQSLIHILDCTATPPGRRLFRRRILSPLHSETQLNQWYDEIDAINQLPDDISMRHLQNIDMEHQFRRLQIGNMAVPSVYRFFRFMSEFRLVCDRLPPTVVGRLDIFMPRWKQLEDAVDEKWDMTWMQTWKSWDNGIWRITPFMEMEDEVSQLELKIRNWVKDGFGEEMISRLVYTEEEVYLQITKKMAKEIRLPADASMRSMAQNMRIQHPRLDHLFRQRRQLQLILSQKRKNLFEEEMRELVEAYEDLFSFIIDLSARIDVLLANAMNARRFRLSRPVPSDSSFRCEGLRHLIVEKTGKEFVPNDVDVSNILLFGQNSAGKCFIRDTRMVLADGTVKNIQDLTIHDALIGDDGRDRHILKLVSGRGQMYDVVRTDTGAVLMTVNAQHILCLCDPNRSRIHDIPIEQILEMPHQTYRYIMNQCTAKNVLHNDERVIERGDLSENEWRQLYVSQLRAGRRIASFSGGRLVLEAIDNNIVPITIRKREQEEEEYFGFGLDGNHRFLMPDGTLAHNSTLMKSVGVATIMAQTGMFVPAARMEWRPMHSIFTKIGTRDNIWKGKSTFITEMNELRHILDKADEYSLVLCDELTAGTETFSATGIVAASLNRLMEKKSRFIMTTHLHTLKNFTELMNDPRLSVMHLGMEYDTRHRRLIFDRILRPGFGKSIYGLEIAEYLGFDAEFIKKAFAFRARLDDEPVLRRSRYNPTKWMEKCEKCGATKDLHTHHIRPQASATPDGYIGVYPKDAAFNLMTLCASCHRNEHSSS